MIRSSRKTYPFYVAVDLIFAGLIFYIVYIFKYSSLYSSLAKTLIAGASLPSFREYSFVFMLWSVFIVIFFSRKGLYVTDRSLTIPAEISRVVLCILYTGVIMGTVVFFAQYKFFSREVFLKSLFMFCVFLSGWRTVKRMILRRLIEGGFHNTNVLIVGAGKIGNLILEEIKKMPWWGFKVAGFLDDNKEGLISGLPVLGKLKDFGMAVKKHFIDEVIVTISSDKKIISQLISQAKELRLGVRVVPENFEESLPVLNINYLGIVPLLTYKERKRHPAEFALKRLFDLVVSISLLILLSPLLAFIAIFIKLSGPGPVFYVQKRAGFKGRLFNFYKFRSMVKGADEMKPQLLKYNEVKDGIIFKIRNDPRVTAAGRFIRRFSLDELPQLFNVIKGDMSLVGPRPPTPDEVEKYSYTHMSRLSIRPGITGLSQVRGRSTLTFKKWVKWDLWYVKNWSFFFDLRILLWTIPAILRGEGAY